MWLIFYIHRIHKFNTTMNSKFLIKLSFFLVFVLSLVSCDDDLSAVGGQVIDTIPGNGFTKEEIEVVAYTERIEKAQINGLPGVLLGRDQDTRFGPRTYNVLSQMSLASYAPTISETAVLKNVIVSIPYFSTVTASTTDSETKVVSTTYKLDSIRNASANLKLAVYYSDYFLADFDENNPEDAKIYFSDGTTILPNIKQKLLGTSEPEAPSASEVIIPENICDGDSAKETRLSPRLQVTLNSPEALTLFADILKKGKDSELSNDNNFKAFFRGILLEVDPSSAALLYLNLADANITINYEEVKDESKTEDCEKFEKKTLVLNFSGNTLNLVDGDFNKSMKAKITSPDTTSGEAALYLKGGGNGSIGVIKLFSETPEILEELKADNVIINNALLRCYVSDQMTAEELKILQSQRLYIYNYKTGQPLDDIFTNPQIGSTNPSASYTNHLGPLLQEGDDYYFDIRITQHVKNLIYNNNDKENPLLGLCVTPNTELPLGRNQLGIFINQNTIKAVENGSDGTSKIPVGAIIDPDGIVLVGNKTTDAKKLKLILTYTQPIN